MKKIYLVGLTLLLGACASDLKLEAVTYPTSDAAVYNYVNVTAKAEKYANQSLTITFKESHGGSNVLHMMAANTIIERGDFIRIDGVCESACTLMVDMAAENTCVTERAVLGYHMFYIGKNHFAPEGYYKQAVFDWVSENGGWHSDKMTIMQGEDLLRFYKLCT